MTGRRPYVDLGLEPVQEHGAATVGPVPGSFVVDGRTGALAVVRGVGPDGMWLHLRRPGRRDDLPWTAQPADVRPVTAAEAAEIRVLELAAPTPDEPEP